MSIAKNTVGLVLIFLLSACASYSEIKTLKPDSTYFISNGKAENLSKCLQEGLKETGYGATFHRSYDTLRNKWFVITETTNPFKVNSAYVHSVSFADEPNHTEVEFRSIEGYFIDTRNFSSIAIDILKECQAALNP